MTASIPVSEIAEPSTVRLISTAYITEPALSPLYDTDEERQVLEALEGRSSARLAPVRMPPDVDPSELLTPAAGFGYTYVNAAFCYVKPDGNRFNDGRRGAWYAAIGKDAAKTSQAEVIFHLTRELDHVGIYDNITAYRELLAGIIGPFHDLRGMDGEPALSPDIATAYPAGQALARRIFEGGGNGVLYPSARRRAGTCLAAFRPHLIQNIRLGETITFEWKGEREPEVLAS
ncbi:RES family NAD+ phosphorylase [Rhizobium sp. TH2]|uniref:RES family NAD+ phosphorylase n=1 Tax=Rhizobium sp. TH2 TaxID=2775403 RepID=UPI002157D00B|nr:RES family NAD+ phosphorylase [Rhizobium sp. TH2]UVC10292.1 RES family NAD+ phosphorylase [Rhizobium sp. TH2]